MSKDETSIRIESFPNLVESLAEFIGPTNLDGEVNPMMEVFHYTIMRSQQDPQRLYIAYAQRGYDGKIHFRIRMPLEGFPGPLEEAPLVHEWTHPKEKIGMYPDKVVIKEAGFTPRLVEYWYRQERLDDDAAYYVVPVTLDVYECLKELFDELPWEETQE